MTAKNQIQQMSREDKERLLSAFKNKEMDVEKFRKPVAVYCLPSKDIPGNWLVTTVNAAGITTTIEYTNEEYRNLEIIRREMENSKRTI